MGLSNPTIPPLLTKKHNLNSKPHTLLWNYLRENYKTRLLKK